MSEPKPNHALQTAVVVANNSICREHFRLSLRLDSFASAAPGQFVHISPVRVDQNGYRQLDQREGVATDVWRGDSFGPLLRRAFSIAGLRNRPQEGLPAGRVEIDIIYRVVGTATRWMSARQHGDKISVLGPLGNRFPISDRKKAAWLVAGGVGLPPILWLADALMHAGKNSVAFYGAQSRDLVALTLHTSRLACAGPLAVASSATRCAVEFARSKTPVIISTDDGSLGFHGHVGQALASYHESNCTSPDDLVVYTCGPERMMRFVAEFCNRIGIECFVCMERAMACGTGTCQSCVVPIHDDTDADGWRYRLCCADGPVFDARDIVWAPVTRKPT